MADIIQVAPIQQAGILYLYSIRDEIDMSPSYQRMGDVWPVSKRQLLIDSILNGYDLPKIYFHEFSKPIEKDGSTYRYAVVDGKQRLNAIFQFIDNGFPLADDFTYMRDPEIRIEGLTYSELAKKQPKIKMLLDAYTLPVYGIRADDLDLIEDMFSRLNEAAPLNAAEKRNAFGGPLPKIIRELSGHDFFERKVKFDNKRFRHYDLIAKLLLLCHKETVTDTKKIHLDRFVKSFKDADEGMAKGLQEQVLRVLNELCKVFIDSDPLLKSMGIVPVYFWVQSASMKAGYDQVIDRTELLKFEDERKRNRELAQDDEADEKVQYHYLEFDRLNQTPNDAYAIRFRIEVLAKRILHSEVQKEVLQHMEAGDL
ncbi:DUF262 domain-containing protein [Halomonas beimenensis]|uniref:GmrSD restriction endonucleases N-terminal domain-containing protein n=1 Tax=Halomonas beimenensis TaxID=475662 RepID=A0A291P642_9GAMM|nr:DUF262 domain-containing protein [Halomonas beimenensis]ATJ82373.1 hypothetical protein BEI_1386 [Halomonas beimenensis]